MRQPAPHERGGTRQGQFFASCPRGLEDLLLGELRALGIGETRGAVGGVRFTGSLTDAYRTCLWSRVASRVMVLLAEIPARDAGELHANAVDLPWERHVAPAATIAVDFTGVSEQLRNSLFGARRVKDAVVDRLRAVSGLRPSVDVRDPDLRIVAHLARERLTLAIDLVGAQHRRGWRGATGAAPLKENLAAALLLRAGWPAIAAAGGALYDPMCGSGTLLIEGGLIAAGAAPASAARWPRAAGRATTGCCTNACSARRARGAPRGWPGCPRSRAPTAMRACSGTHARTRSPRGSASTSNSPPARCRHSAARRRSRDAAGC